MEGDGRGGVGMGGEGKGGEGKGREGRRWEGRGREGSVVESKKILKIDPGFSRAAVRREPQCVRALRRHN